MRLKKIVPKFLSPSSAGGALLALALAASPAFALDPAPATPPAAAPAAQSASLTVFAAASLKNALDEAVKAWKAKTGQEIAVSFAASFPLARQIEAGAPADIFIGADEESADYLAGKKLIKPETRKDFLSNELVLIAPASGAAKVELTAAGLTGVLKDQRLAMGDPASVPAGKYAQAALARLGAWDAVKDKLALADSVRSALLYVSRGETPLGIVYATDAKAAPDTRIVAIFPESSHPPIRYPIAETATAKPETDKFLAWLLGPEAATYFKSQGFGVLTVK
jgi:molybdate transport system substrate-binding protein